MIRRSQSGNFIADTPAVIWILFMLITFPLLNLATCAMRYTFMLTASRDAALAASRAKTYFTDPSPNDLSAIHSAEAAARQDAAAFTGVTITQVSTRILANNLATSSTTAYDRPLPDPADTTEALYLYESTVTGFVQPLLPFNNTFFGNIPGLTAPMPVSVSSQKVCENTQGLNQ